MAAGMEGMVATRAGWAEWAEVVVGSKGEVAEEMAALVGEAVEGGRRMVGREVGVAGA